ncbi:B12-binding domain-containing radical SAM protein [Sulfitobacter guttiformis]|uniref:DUF4070 domain-containing protein n=1 Tax=Sulfitobacter guttiformis TaxID=74349 RepID=UPI000688ED10|nr:DUF4070 domain-containing protein [Sulfitobacter guttiformis]KIN72027.1 Radical SAM domain protein [Sulfitobacter guttiformis KCTC 32187]
MVDDNFIANKAKAKELLIEIVKWPEQHGYPLSLNTEASLDLADEPELLELLVKANFTSVFIGIESPRNASLEETLKFQNTRAGTTEDKIQRVRDAGLMITAGFIVGFDSDDPEIFQEQYDFINRIAVAKAAIAILTPIPTTPLYDRLKAEGRLKPFGEGLQFVPKQIDPQDLIARYNTLRQDLYEPPVYFQRVFDSITKSEGFQHARIMMNNRRQRAVSGTPVDKSSRHLKLVYKRLRNALGKSESGQEVLGAYKQQWRKNCTLVEGARLGTADFLSACINHWHYYRIVHEGSSDYIGSSDGISTAAK